MLLSEILRAPASIQANSQPKTIKRYCEDFVEAEEFCAALMRQMSRVVEQGTRRKFRVDEELRYNCSLFSQWLCGNSGYIFLYICGGNGCGKSTMAKAFQQLASYLMPLEEYHYEDMAVGRVTAKNINSFYLEKQALYKQCREIGMLIIDEFSKEKSEVVDYGNRHNPMEELICYRYDHRLPTIFLSNFPVQSIKEYYGVDIMDRFEEVSIVMGFGRSSYRREAE